METNLFTRDENLSFWKNALLVVFFLAITPITLGVSLFSLISLKSDAAINKDAALTSVVTSPISGVQVYASLPSKPPAVDGTVGSADARPEIVRQYLERYNSPLAPYSENLVAAADKYVLDFRLLPAIAQQESNLCKVIPPGSFNCWGWGITSQDSLGFRSFQEGIDIVSKGLRENYLNKGYTTVADIMSKYTPQSNGSWAAGVVEFMTDMQ